MIDIEFTWIDYVLQIWWESIYANQLIIFESSNSGPLNEESHYGEEKPVKSKNYAEYFLKTADDSALYTNLLVKV